MKYELSFLKKGAFIGRTLYESSSLFLFPSQYALALLKSHISFHKKQFKNCTKKDIKNHKILRKIYNNP